jgi:hypothetical protein
VPFPFGPLIGIESFASPLGPSTWLLPEIKLPAFIGEPRASMTRLILLRAIDGDLVGVRLLHHSEREKECRRDKGDANE